MKRNVLAAALVCVCTVSVQANCDWSGKVVDENGEPMPYTNVVLMTKADSTAMGGTITAGDGSFEIRGDAGSQILMIGMIGYKSQYLDSPAQDTLIRLVPDTYTLDGVEITAVIPKTVLTGDGLQTLVSGSVLENVGTANDVLSKTPGLMKGQEGIEVIGKGAPLVYINGRKVTDATELDRLLSSEIQNVEVITNPGAQYDASVRSVVRIRTVRRQGDGFGFNVSATDEQSLRRWANNDPRLDVNLNYRIRNVDLFAGTDVFKFTSRQESDVFSETFEDPVYVSNGWLTNDIEQKAVHANTGMNWQIADNHSVGFKLEYGVSYALPSFEELHNEMTRNGRPYDKTVTIGNYGNGDRSPYTLSSNVYYNGQVGRLGIDLNLDFYKTHASQVADINEYGKDSPDTDTNAEIRTESASDNSLYAAKLVLSYPVWKGQLQLGTEDMFSRRDDSYSITGTGIPPSSSDVDEDSYAAFASYGFALPQVGMFSAGVRYEHVDYSFADNLGDDSSSRKYDNAFPSFSYSGAFGPVQLMAAFSVKTSRPNFSMLSSSLKYNSKYIIQSGNPSLQPQTLKEFNLTVNWRWLTLVAEYSRTDDAIVSWSTRYNDDGVMLVRPRNLEDPMRSMAVYINASPTVKFWTLNCTAGIQPQWLDLRFADPQKPETVRTISFNNKPLLFAQMFNTFKFRNDWQFEVGGEIHSKGYVQNLMMTNVYFDQSAAIQKSFLKDKSLVVRLEGRNLAGLGNIDVESDFGALSIVQTTAMDTQRLVLSVRYHFNAAQSKYRGTGAGIEVKNRMNE